MIADFHFLRPWWLFALFLPPLILWLASRAGDYRDRWRDMIAPHLLDHLVVEPDGRRHMHPAWTLAAAMTLAILSGAGPTWRREAPPFVSDAASLVIAIDLSPTMDAIDITPSRLERAKLKIADILAARQGARTAVVAYAGTAHLVVPLTEDDALIRTYTDALATRIMPKPGKDTIAAIALADTLLEADGSAGTILLMTDGIEEGAAERATQPDSSVVVLGIGTAEGGLVKQADGSFLNGAGGSRLVARLDLDGLKSFAGAHGFPVATVTNDDADIRWIVRHVSTNFTQQTAKEGDRWHDAGWWLLFPAALILALSFRRGWVVKLAMLCFCLRLAMPVPASAAEMVDMWLTPDQQGRRAFEKGDFEAAASHFQDPMWKGVALYRAERFQDAIDAFAAVDTAESWFDQANSLFHLGSLDDAVAAYGKALEKRPDWPEAAADLAVAERLLKLQKDQQTEQPQDPNQKPDSVQFDDKGKQGKAGTVAVAEQTSEMWMKNIEVSPTDLMARKFAIELREAKP
jgi:Ca-activated chloride channel family protein